jgi:hypothetical protein
VYSGASSETGQTRLVFVVKPAKNKMEGNMKRQSFSKKGRLVAGGILTLFILLTLIAPVFAEGEGDEVPDDPGVGGTQDETKSDSVVWVLPYGYAYYIDDEAGNIELDWQNVDLEYSDGSVEGVIPLTGTGVCGGGEGLAGCTQEAVIVPYLMQEDLNAERLGFPPDTGAKGYQDDCTQAGNDCEKIDGGVPDGGTFNPSNNPTVVVIKAGPNEFYYVPMWMVCNPAITAYCATWNGDGSITVVRYGGTEISNIQFWNLEYEPFGENEEFIFDPSLNCPDVWITPGILTISAEQIAPTAALVVGQDLSETGATIEYHITVDPTYVLYQRWELLGKERKACVEGVNNTADYMDECGTENCNCPNGWHMVFEDVYGCKDKVRVYPEGIANLHPGAELSLNSRLWIEGELAAAYPGAHLLNPDWQFSSENACDWQGNVCHITFTLTIPAVDPGWYDITLEGLTTGTLASPARNFDIKVGKFGVYMIDSSLR